MKGKSLNLKNGTLLDIWSTLKATIINTNLVADIRTIRKLVGMMTNVVTKLSTLEVTVKGIGHGCYFPTQVADIFSFSHLK